MYFRLGVQKILKEQDLKSAQIEWESVKPRFQRALDLVKRDSPELAKILKRGIESVESDLYPERNKNKGSSGLIWFLVIGGVIVVGLISLTWFGKRKKKN